MAYEIKGSIMKAHKHRVIVIGGGLSGLTAAFQLEKDLPEASVTVLEANSYPGGRMLTTEFGGEGGGEAIGFYYTTLHALASEVGIKLTSAPMSILNKAFNIAYYFKNQNEWVKQKDWAEWQNNPLPIDIQKITPMMLLRYYIAKIPKPSSFEHVFTDPFFTELSQKSLEAFLKEQDVPAEALSIIKTNSEVDDITKVSAFNIAMKTWITESVVFSNYYFVHGGQQNLPKAIAANLKDIHYNTKVTSVKKMGDQYEVQAENGEIFICDSVVFTVPAGPMRSIQMDPPLTGLQKEAFEKIQYTPSVKTFFRVTSPFWEKDGLPLFMWTDTDINMVVPVYNKDTRETPLSGPDVWGIYAFSSGQTVERLYQAEQKDRISLADHTKSILEKIRPSTQGCLEFVETVDWGRMETAQGAFHYYLPSAKIPSYYEAINQPSLGRYFAGEHTELKSRGFDAAVYAGIRVAKEICQDVILKHKQ
ncbi:MAG: NAD(P)/FAD-dependent oxidoreductase [Parachlamydiales bacterium]|jgi:monoamine oxidase